MDILQ